MVRAGPYQVAVVGYVTAETKSIVLPPNARGLRFASGYPPIQDAVEAARAAHPDFLVLLAHAGGRCDSLACAGEIFDLAQSLPPGSVDVVVSGHSHTRIDAERGGVPIVQAWSNGTGVGVVDIVRTAAGGRRYDVSVETVWDDQVAPDTALANLVNQAVRRIDSLASRVITDLALPMTRTGNQYPLGNLIADAYRNVLRADVGLVNNGGIRTDLAPGPLTYGQLFALIPFQNQVVSVTVTGAQLREVMEDAITAEGPDAHVSGLTVTYDSTRPEGHRVLEVRLAGGKKLKDRGRYSLATSSYLAAGQGGYTVLRGAPQSSTGLNDIETVERYLLRLPKPVQPPEDHRFLPVRR